jgi:hypothetical protein
MNRSKPQTTVTTGRDEGAIAMRRARADDEPTLERLAELDTHPPLDGTVLIAEVGGEVRAARSLGTGETIADPFQPSAHLRDLLSSRAAQMVPSPGRAGWFAVRWRRLYARAEAR